MLILSEEQRAGMVAYARKTLPYEACGLFGGAVQGTEKIVKQVYYLTNGDTSAEHFSLVPAEQFAALRDLRRNGWVLLGCFHSHPAGPVRPSGEDIRLAFDPALSYVIISLSGAEPGVKSFLIRDGGVSEEPMLG